MSSVPAIEEVIAVLKREKPRLLKRFPVQGLYVFGSVTRGEATADSDIDIMVDVDPSIGLEFVTLAEEIKKNARAKSRPCFQTRGQTVPD